MRKFTLLIVFFVAILPCFATTSSILNYNHDYFEYLVLTGNARRSYIQYTQTEKTDDQEDHFKILSPQIFASYNTNNPYSYNDEALWQGRGFNTKIQVGAAYRTGGFSFALYPEFDFSQNKEYETIQSSDSRIISNNVYEYFWGTFDLPQRFGNSSLFSFNFGNTEVRYSNSWLTVAASTKARWIGTGKQNSILLSNNAPNFPYFEIGFKKQPVFNIGEMESFYSIGILKNSAYARVAPKEKSILSTFSIAYAPSLIHGLSLGFNVTGQSDFTANGLLNFYQALFQPSKYSNTGDARFSFSADWLFPEAGFEAFSEVGWNHSFTDLFTSDLRSSGFILGARKSFDILPDKNIYGEISVELSTLEFANESFVRDSEPYSFYASANQTSHSSYTNQGQLLGSSTGYAGNSQYLDLTVFYPNGLARFFVQRSNPDNDYLHYITIEDSRESIWKRMFDNYKGIFDIGLSSTFFPTKTIEVSAGIVYEYIINYAGFIKTTNQTNLETNNFHGELGLKYVF